MSIACQESIKTALYKYFDPTAWQAQKQVEWGFHMSVELPVVRILNEQEINWQPKLQDQLKQITNIVGESNLVINEQGVVQDYRSIHGGLVNLDMDFVC